MKRILVTGHCGLIGRHLVPRLAHLGFKVRGLDLADGSGDITRDADLSRAVEGCHGVVHLAALSRVVHAHRDPGLCWRTNALASENLLGKAFRSPLKPWVLVASSREVYGEPRVLPVTEDMPLAPVNVYGRAKQAMERAAGEARQGGLNTAIVRLANVYGCPDDHPDRVVPAFCRAAVDGEPLQVEGFENLFDFTHIDDTVAGLVCLIRLLETGERNLPPVHLLPGIGTTLLEVAQMAVTSAVSRSRIIRAPSRQYDVSRFVGDPGRARDLLGWRARVAPQRGIAELVSAFEGLRVAPTGYDAGG